jgi:sulfur relay (sulfurtransferase) complex TusBCD TusD component (DsrE family)
MKILLIVNSSPWGSTLGVTALRVARAVIAEDMILSAVFFREDGVFQTRRSRITDAGTPALAESWAGLAADSDTRLLVCSSSSQRNFSDPASDPFREAGLAELMELMANSDRVVTL